MKGIDLEQHYLATKIIERGNLCDTPNKRIEVDFSISKERHMYIMYFEKSHIVYFNGAVYKRYCDYIND